MSANQVTSNASGKEIGTLTVVNAKTHFDASRAFLNWDIHNPEMAFPNKTEITILTPKDEEEFYSTFEPLKSPIFVTNLGNSKTKESKQKWYVELSGPNIASVSNKSENYIALYLHRDGSPSSVAVSDEVPFRLYASFYILGEDNVEYLKHSTGTLSELCSPNSGGWGFSEFVSLKTLWENKNTYLVNEHVLRLRVELTVFGSPVTESEVLQRVSRLSCNKIMNDMRQLLKSGKNSDVKIICGNREFLAHAAILKGHCHLFKQMLEIEMTESKTRLIKVEDVDPIVFEAFLEYIYTAEVELSEKNLDKLFGLIPVADKYGSEELKAICFQYIYEHMSDENAGRFALLSLEHNAGDNIRSQVVAFCLANWSKLSQLEAFKACVLENPRAFFH